ncbi:hypothetical protein E2C01_013291 [Portunus trituberculatus]|uniref:Uncharacterized protein n=1 Tax=Portunus trituberculatus TaxID=210409 RepID=A0A5B7DG94_PORTR|nr:hypothetical protein [Portunus trituberculatus]
MDRWMVQVVILLYEENEDKFTIGDISTGLKKNNIGIRQGYICDLSYPIHDLHTRIDSEDQNEAESK